jgi:hypothetical protein
MDQLCYLNFGYTVASTPSCVNYPDHNRWSGTSITTEYDQYYCYGKASVVTTEDENCTCISGSYVLNVLHYGGGHAAGEGNESGSWIDTG